MSSVLRSGSLVSAISVTWASVMLPATSRPGFSLALSSPAAWRTKNEVGGVLVTKENVRSSKIVISTGTTWPRLSSVRALYSLQKSMIATPWGPRARYQREVPATPGPQGSGS